MAAAVTGTAYPFPVATDTDTPEFFLAISFLSPQSFLLNRSGQLQLFADANGVLDESIDGLADLADRAFRTDGLALVTFAAPAAAGADFGDVVAGTAKRRQCPAQPSAMSLFADRRAGTTIAIAELGPWMSIVEIHGVLIPWIVPFVM